jgi:hypothetical protein
MPPLALPHPADQKKVAGYGRLYAPDPRDQQFPLRTVIGRGAARGLPRKRWRLGAGQHWRIQAGPTCVGHGVTHLRALTPFLGHNLDPDFPYRVYRWAQQNDEWAGENYDGTSVRAGLQYLRKVDGSVDAFLAAQSIDDALRRLALPKQEGGGPLVVGTDFYSGMSVESVDGQPGEWVPSGDYWGGHCYVLVGYEPATAALPERVLVGNSHEGNTVGWMRIDALDFLLFQSNGDCYAVTEVAR